MGGSTRGEVQMKKRLLYIALIGCFAALALPAGAAPEELKLSNPMVAAAKTDKAKLGLTVATATTAPTIVAKPAKKTKTAAKPGAKKVKAKKKVKKVIANKK